MKKTASTLEGKTIKNFMGPMTGNQSFNLKDWKGKNVVLYFYPKDSTPGCTIEGHEFSKLKTEFKKYNTVVFGLSRDSIKSHENFKTKQCYSIELISDEDEKICKQFDVIKQKNMYGKLVMGIERSTFVINSDSVCVKEFRKIKAEGHAKDVLTFIKTLA